MYQQYDIPFMVEGDNGLQISVDEEDAHLVYRRSHRVDGIESVLSVKNCKVTINPMEPVTIPKELTPYLLITMTRKLMVAPKRSTVIYLRFPVEIGIYISSMKELKRVDGFTLVKQKYTLYGDPRHGILCKYWESDIYSSMPSPNRLEEGIVELSISNGNSAWVELSQVVFNAYGMKIYFDDQRVAMKARMKIVGPNIAETEFVDSPLKPGMKKAIESYRVSKMAITDAAYVMEMGL